MKNIIFCCISLVFASGCSKNNNSDNQNATDIFPNKVGDTWLYLVNDTTVNRANPDSPAVQYYLTVSVIDSIQLPGDIRANVWVYSFPGGTDTNYVFQKGDTIRFIDINQTVYSLDSRQYIIPLSLHESWQYSMPSFHEVTVDSQFDIVVGQNRFENVFHIFGYAGMPDAGFVIDEWIKDYVGIVKRHFNPSGMLIDPRHVTAWSLISYHLE